MSMVSGGAKRRVPPRSRRARAETDSLEAAARRCHMFSIRSPIIVRGPEQRREQLKFCCKWLEGEGEGGLDSPRNPWLRRRCHNRHGKFCCKSRCKCSKPGKSRLNRRL